MSFGLVGISSSPLLLSCYHLISLYSTVIHFFILLFLSLVASFHLSFTWSDDSSHFIAYKIVISLLFIPPFVIDSEIFA